MFHDYLTRNYSRNTIHKFLFRIHIKHFPFWQGTTNINFWSLRCSLVSGSLVFYSVAGNARDTRVAESGKVRPHSGSKLRPARASRNAVEHQSARDEAGVRCSYIIILLLLFKVIFTLQTLLYNNYIQQLWINKLVVFIRACWLNARISKYQDIKCMKIIPKITVKYV